MRPWIVGVAAAMTLAGVAAQAHHSIAGVYDSAREATVDGVVTQFRFARPHPWIDLRERWTPSFGQVFVTAKVESGFMIQAAFGWPEVGRSPRLRSASSLVYASSGVRPLSDEWGRHRL